MKQYSSSAISILSLRISSWKLMIAIIVQLTIFNIVHSGPINLEHSCHLVRQLYHRHHSHHHHHNNQHGSHSSISFNNRVICPATIVSSSSSRSSTNCCHGLDDAISEKALEDFNNQLNGQLKITQFGQQFQQYFNRIQQKLDTILNETVSQVNEVLVGQERILLANKQLFDFVRKIIFESSSLSLTSKSLNAQLIDHIDDLLGTIFITQLQQYHQKEYPAEYESCLLHTLKEINILSKSRDDMIFRFTRTVQASSLIVHLLENSLQMINETINEIKIDDKCVERLARTFHCQYCFHPVPPQQQQKNFLSPCSSVCYETINSCLNQEQMHHMDMIMKSLTNSYQQLVNLMVDLFNPEILLTNHLTSIEQTKKIIRSENDKIAKNARTACGLMKRYFRSAGGNNAGNGNGGSSNAYDYYNYSTPTPNEEVMPGKSLYVSIQSVAHLFTQHKDMFANLNKKICNQYNNHNCWNGTDIVENFHQEAQQQLQPQSLVALEDPDDNNDNSIVNLFSQVKRSEKKIEELLINNQKSSYNHHNLDGSDLERSDINSSRNFDDDDNDGSGSGDNPFPDDEDYNGSDNGSGSDMMIDSINNNNAIGGIGGKTETPAATDIVFDPVTRKPIVLEPKDPGSSSRNLPTPNLLSLIIFFISYALLFV